MQTCNITPFPPHCQYPILGILLVKSLYTRGGNASPPIGQGLDISCALRSLCSAQRSIGITNRPILKYLMTLGGVILGYP